MSDALKEILSRMPEHISQDMLLDYLNGRLNDAQRHEVEKYLLDNDIAEEALEGLKLIDRKDQIPTIVKGLNHHLKKQLTKKAYRKKGLSLRDQPWLIVAVIILLVLIVLAYIVIYKMVKEA